MLQVFLWNLHKQQPKILQKKSGEARKELFMALGFLLKIAAAVAAAKKKKKKKRKKCDKTLKGFSNSEMNANCFLFSSSSSKLYVFCSHLLHKRKYIKTQELKNNLIEFKIFSLFFFSL